MMPRPDALSIPVLRMSIADAFSVSRTSFAVAEGRIESRTNFTSGRSAIADNIRKLFFVAGFCRPMISRVALLSQASANASPVRTAELHPGNVATQQC